MLWERCQQNMKQAAEDRAQFRPAQEIREVFLTAPIRWPRKMGVAKALRHAAGISLASGFSESRRGNRAIYGCLETDSRGTNAELFREPNTSTSRKRITILLVAKILTEDGLDVNTRSRALQDVVWSTAVQHGGATPIVHKAIANVIVSAD